MNLTSKITMTAIKTTVETGASVFVPIFLSNISTVIGIIAGLFGMVYMFFKMRNEIHTWKKNNKTDG